MFFSTIIDPQSSWGNLRLDYQGTTTDRHANLAIQTPLNKKIKARAKSVNMAQILVPLSTPIPQTAIRDALRLSANSTKIVRLVIRQPGKNTGGNRGGYRSGSRG